MYEHCRLYTKQQSSPALLAVLPNAISYLRDYDSSTTDSL